MSLGGRIDLIIDSGPTTVGLESTVLDLTSSPPHILRPGPITAAMVERVLGNARVREFEPVEAAAPEQPMSPGRLAVHYAPRTRAVRVDDPRELVSFPWPDRAIVVIVGPNAAPPLPDTVARFVLPTPAAAAHDLYGVLHECDARAVDLIVLVPPPDLPEWSAVRDRMARAAPLWNSSSRA
jgi:L-threonylcarbamoyladenylate synthase